MGRPSQRHDPFVLRVGCHGPPPGQARAALVVGGHEVESVTGAGGIGVFGGPGALVEVPERDGVFVHFEPTGHAPRTILLARRGKLLPRVSRSARHSDLADAPANPPNRPVLTRLHVNAASE